jgi:hypothetical protein
MPKSIATRLEQLEQSTGTAGEFFAIAETDEAGNILKLRPAWSGQNITPNSVPKVVKVLCGVSSDDL